MNRMQRGRITVLLVVLFLTAPITAYADLGVGLSVEQFTWTEKSDSGARLLRERGPRHVANLEWMNTSNPNFSYGYIGKLYLGKVSYVGRMQTGAPFTTTTAYEGSSHEFQLNFRSYIKQHSFDYVAGIGLDAWKRVINNQPHLDPVERYESYYLRVGVSVPSRIERGLYFSGGIKYPIQLTERVDGPSNGLDSDITLHPGKEASYYSELGYKFYDTPWRVSLYYDGYRFARSSNVAARIGGRPVLIHQPESDMGIVGIRVSTYF